MSNDGFGQMNLSNHPGYDVSPAWSPDGSKIVFRSNRDGNEEIYIMNADGTGQTNLTNDPGMDWHPVWSPDGTKIAFDSWREGKSAIYVMNMDGSNLINLTNRWGDTNPHWRPRVRESFSGLEGTILLVLLFHAPVVRFPRCQLHIQT